MIKGILFDFDGTLSNRVESAYYMYRYLLHDIFPELNVHSPVFEGRVQRCMLWDEFGTINKRHVLQQIQKKWKEDLDIEHYVKVWYETFHEFQVEQPGCYEVLQELGKHYQLGVITNGNGHTQNLKIDQLDLRKYFETVLVSKDFGKDKPDTSIYHQAAKDLGLKPEEIAFVGDTFDTDILGAIDAGMKPIWYCFEHHSVTVYPVKQIKDFQELRTYFLEELKNELEHAKNMDIWEKLYQAATKEFHPEEVTPFIYAHHVVCALESEDGTIFTGFCIESCCGVMNLCAERVAALNMYVNSGQTKIKRLIAFRDKAPYGKESGMPCGACREFLYQLDKENKNMEIMVDYKNRKTVTLKELMLNWWGEERYSAVDK